MSQERKKPTKDEAAGMAWWNAMSDQSRANWLARTGAETPTEAWAAFKRERSVAAFYDDLDRKLKLSA
jgi:hypothetical protein